MPPRQSLTSTFPATDLENEVVCPLRNQDGSSCRKRCIGDKRYRSMQEHIRRAHSAWYIAKLPATRESFDLMVTTGPHEQPQQQHTSPLQQQLPHHHHHHQQQQRPLHRHTQHSDPSGYGHSLQHDNTFYAQDSEASAIYNSMQAQARSSDEYRRGSLIPAASAAQALAQLHYHRGPDSDWGNDNVHNQGYFAEQGNDLKNHHAFHVDPTLDEPFMQDPTSFPTSAAQDHAALLSSSMTRSPNDRHTLPQLQRSLSKQNNRPRKSSLTQARLAKHERKKSKDAKRISGDKKALLNEHNIAAFGKRWEDLLDAATSATEEEGSRDLTPIPASPYQSPQANPRTSLPPFALGSQFQSYQQSPLNRALTPPPADTNLELQPFPSVESSLSSHQHNNSAGSGSQFQIMNPASMDSSPIFGNNTNTATNNNNANSHHPSMSEQIVQIYCAGCKKLNILAESYACTNCICGLCQGCVEALVDNQRTGRMSGCPKCSLHFGTFKPFQLDLR